MHNTHHYLLFLIRECENKYRQLTDLLAQFPEYDLHTKQTHGRCHYMIHWPGGRIYARTQERPICRELAVKQDVEAQLEDTRIDLAILRALEQGMAEHPHRREKLYENPCIRPLLDEAYGLLRRNGTFFRETEWQNLISGRLDERFYRLADEEYRAIMSAGHVRSGTGTKLQIPESISPRLRKIRSGLIQTGTDSRVQDWLNEDYQKCPFRPEDLIYPTYDGERFRSKLEVHTAEILKRLSIAYRYEAALKIGNEVYYPDFTLLHPKTYQLIYLEILGLMSDKEYQKRTAKKLYVYTANGLVVGKNLLVYSETADEPLDFEFMEYELEHKLLR